MTTSETPRAHPDAASNGATVKGDRARQWPELRGFGQLLRGLQPRTLDALVQVKREMTIPAGAVIMREGDRTTSLYYIESGHVAVYREAREGEVEKRLNDLHDGVTLGEMALVDGQPRSASARAETECKVVVINPDDLLELSDGALCLSDLKGGLATEVTMRMRAQTDRYAAALEREMTAIKERQQFGQFFLYILGLMSIGMVVNDVIAKQVLGVDALSPLFAWLYLFILLVPAMLMVWQMKIPFKDIGLTTNGLKKSVIEGSVLSVISLVLCFGLAWFLRTTGIHEGTVYPPEWIASSSYFLHSLFQEIMARGLLQSSFHRFLDDRRGVRSVVLASALFGVFHLHFGFLAVTMTILSGLVFGAVYRRHQNVFGVTILHFFVGAAAFWSGLF